jgi:hypothetical protein
MTSYAEFKAKKDGERSLIFLLVVGGFLIVFLDSAFSSTTHINLNNISAYCEPSPYGCVPEDRILEGAEEFHSNIITLSNVLIFGGLILAVFMILRYL